MTAAAGAVSALKLLPYGLVSSSTSDPGPTLAGSLEFAKRRLGASAAHAIDRKGSRLRRMKHSVLTAARLTDEQLRRGSFRYHAVMVTLTYEVGQTWHRRNLSSFLHRVRQWHKGHGKKMNYVWTAEMQKRGEVHYHVVFWMPSGLTLPKPDRKGWWNHGMSNVMPCKTGVGYIAKYASKGAEGPAFPRGVRIHGQGGLDHEGKRIARWWRSPSEAREFFGTDADIRAVKGGRFDLKTGLFWRSPWRIIFVWGQPHMFKIEGVLQ